MQAVVSGSDMSRADFRHADLLGARFDAGSKLGCTDLTGALYGMSGGRSPWPCGQFDPLDTGRDEEFGVSSKLRQSPGYPCLADPCDAGNTGKAPAGRSSPPSPRPPPPPGPPQPPQTPSSEVGSWSFIDGVYTWTGVNKPAAGAEESPIYLVDGCGTPSKTCTAFDATARHGVRCCQDQEGQAGAEIGECAEPAPIGQPECSVAKAMTLEEAIAGCAEIGKRLCSADELIAGVCCGTTQEPNKAGCHVLDSALIWSATSCEVPSG